MLLSRHTTIPPFPDRRNLTIHIPLQTWDSNLLRSFQYN